MSLLQFAKDNKEYLNLISTLTDDDPQIRSQTLSSILKQLNDEEANHSDIKLLEATPLIKYTLQRLIRGLTSSQHSKRIAFANAFSQVLTHCKWLTTSFILNTVNAFCDHEKAQQSTIIESLLLIRNLLILILFQTHRLYELSWSDLELILTEIVTSKQAKNLIDLSCQSMICLLDIMEKENDEATKHQTGFKMLLIGHREDLLKTFSKLIPSPINSFKLISVTQIKLILRMYSNHHQFTNEWTLIKLIDNKTIHILPKKIELVYEFLLKPIKKAVSASAPMSITSMMNIYNDERMWKALISLYCNSELKEVRNKKFGKCCDTMFYFVKQQMLRPKYVSLISIICLIFIRCGVELSISNDTLFTRVLYPAVLSFITKHALKYKENNKEHNSCKQAFDFMMELKLLSGHTSYGSRVKSILISSNLETSGNNGKSSSDSNMKTLVFYEKVFWRANGFIYAHKLQHGNQLVSNMRDCITSIKSISNVLQQYVHIKGKEQKLKSMDALWVKKGIRFMIRVVFFRSRKDIFNKTVFENIVLTARKELRVLLQKVWNQLPSNEAKDELNKKVFIEYVNEAIESFKEDETLSYRAKTIKARDSAQMTLKSITEITDKIKEIKHEYLSQEQRYLLCDLVRFISVYYYMDDSSVAIKALRHLKDNILSEIDDLQSVAFGSKIMDIVVECIQTDDMFLSSVSRHLLLGFGDLYNSQALEKILRFISDDEEEKKTEEDTFVNDDEEEEEEDSDDDESEESDESDESDDDAKEEKKTDKDEDEDIFMKEDDDEDKKEEEEDSDDSDEDEDSDDSSSETDDFEITDYGAFGAEEDNKDADLEKDDINTQELERMDEALMAVFREKQKQTEPMLNAKKSRIQKRVYYDLRCFVKQYPKSPILLIMFTPLMMSLWKLFEEVTSEYQRAKNKQIKTLKTNTKYLDRKQRKVAPRMRTIHGVPLWRFDGKLKKSWSDYTQMLIKNSKKQSKFGTNAVSTKKKHFQHIVVVIDALLAASPNKMVEADAECNEIKIDFIKDIIYDIIELTSESPTYEHEMLGTKVLCYLSKIYQLKCNQNLSRTQIWNDVKLNEDDEEEDNNAIDTNDDILWLYELWYIQLKLLMKQPKRTWYFSTEFFDVLMRRNPFIVWKLIAEALDVFELCHNSWSKTQIFTLIGNVSMCGVNDSNDMKWILKKVAKRIVAPLKDSLNVTIEPTKKMTIVKSAGKFVRALIRYKVSGANKKKIMDTLGSSALQWKKKKEEKKKFGGKQKKKSYKQKGKQSKNKKNQKSKRKNMDKTKRNQKKRKFQNSKKNNANPNKKRKLK